MYDRAAMSGPWHPARPVWELLSGMKAVGAHEWYEERAAIMEHEGPRVRPAAEAFAYAFLMARLQAAGVLTNEHRTECDSERHLDRYRRIMHDLEFTTSIGVNP